MAKANSENNNLKKILTHLTALDDKVDKGFKHLTALDKKVDALDNKVDKGFLETDKRFKEAAEGREVIRNEVQVMRHGMQAGFKSAEEFQKKTENTFAGFYREMPQMGSELYDKIEGHRKEFRQFQQETFSFQKRTEDFQQQTLIFQEEMRIFKQQSLAFQEDMREAIQHFTRVMERIERDLSILREAHDQLKIEQEKFKLENEELKKAKIEHEATIKKLEQRIAILEVVHNQPAL